MTVPKEAPEYEEGLAIAVNEEVVLRLEMKPDLLMSDLEEEIAARMLLKTFDNMNDPDESTESIEIETIRGYDPKIQMQVGDGDWEEVPLSEIEIE